MVLKHFIFLLYVSYLHKLKIQTPFRQSEKRLVRVTLPVVASSATAGAPGWGGTGKLGQTGEIMFKTTPFCWAKELNGSRASART